MKILIDIGHPAHVHLFKNFAIEMLGKGNDVLFTCREKEFEIALLEHYGFRYKSFGRKYKSLIGKVLGMLEFGIKEWMVGRKFKPDVLLSHGSIYAAQASFFLGKPHIAFEDTFNFEQIYLYKPFTKYILTADYLHPLVSDKVVRYPGYHELAYLHPNRFNPDISVLNELGVKEGEKYVIIRFVSWNASHDICHKGISLESKIKAVHEFEKEAKVFISSEQPLPDQLEKNRIRIAPYKIHHVLAFASLFFGESATMAAEGACLGVPGIYLDNKGRLYTKELEEKYGLCYNYSESGYDQEMAIQKGCQLLKYDKDDLKREFARKRLKLISEKIDVTAFLVTFIEQNIKD
jgi:predicted glycosyltransferase